MLLLAVRASRCWAERWKLIRMSTVKVIEADLRLSRARWRGPSGDSGWPIFAGCDGGLRARRRRTSESGPLIPGLPEASNGRLCSWRTGVISRWGWPSVSLGSRRLRPVAPSTFHAVPWVGCAGASPGGASGVGGRRRWRREGERMDGCKLDARGAGATTIGAARV